MQPDSPHPVPSRRKLGATAVFAVAIAALVVVFGVTTRESADAGLKAWTETQAVPVVAVATPDTRGKTATLNLPGRLEAYAQAQIYARVSGYLKSWNADIGASVKAGQTLAEIDAPDLDQQIMQAEADVTNAKANALLARSMMDRGQTLIQSGAISKVTLDQRAADAASKDAAVKSAEANLARLRVSEKYKKIEAPFAGIVTARTTDVGALINAGGGGAALYVVSDTSKLRLYVNVPQSYVPSIPKGTTATVAVPEYPGRSFTAVVEASSQSVDVSSGTTRMQLAVDNPTGALMTGAFATVSLRPAHPAAAINIPASALIFNQSGLHVATLDADDRVVLKPVTIARDMGKDIELASGLGADDRFIVTPPDGVASGDTVRVAANPAASSSGTALANQPKPRPPG